MTYRMRYSAPCLGSYIQRAGNFGNYATSPVLTWDNLDTAKQEANWNHASVVTGHYEIIDEVGEVVYSTEGQPYQ